MTAYCETMPQGVAAEMANQFAMMVPELRTKRLQLRAPRPEDFAVYAEIACGSRGKGIGGPMSRDEAWYDFGSLASGWMLRGHGGWTITLKGNSEAIGFVLIGAEPGDEEPELGYLIAEAFEGKGYASEAAAAVRDYAFDTLRLPGLVSYIFPSNAPSIAVAKRLGAFEAGNAIYAGDDEPSLVYRYSPEEAL